MRGWGREGDAGMGEKGGEGDAGCGVVDFPSPYLPVARSPRRPLSPSPDLRFPLEVPRIVYC
jgi:hypothetical protein